MVGLRERAHHIAFADGARASAGDEPGRTVSTTLAEILRRKMVGAVNLLETVVSGCKGGMRTYMHSAWNSWPQGKLITLLTPSTYSSRQTTHSFCRPP